MKNNVLVRAAKFLPNRFFRAYSEMLMKTEFEEQTFQPNERTVEYRFVFDSLAQVAPRTVLDVGTGITSLPHLLRTCGYVVTAIDNVTDYWPKGLLSRTMFNRHWHIVDDDIRKTKLDQKVDLITCISTLEHIQDSDAAVDAMFSLLNPGGHLVLTFPYNEKAYVKNVYELKGTQVGGHVTYVCQAFSRSNLDEWLKRNGGRIVTQEYWNCFTGEYWSVGEKVHPPKAVTSDSKHQLSCVLIQKA